MIRVIYSRLTNLFNRQDRELSKKFKLITGRTPLSIGLYKKAMLHVSASSVNDKGIKDSYERLEYLGDAVLGMVVAELLFKRFPYKEEGFLTELRAKIVNRESLNLLSRKIGLQDMVQYQKHKGSKLSHKSVFGDSLEALVGAVYIDHGFKFCKEFITHRLIKPHFDFEELSRTTTNYKSKIIEWVQKESKEIKFEIINSNDNDRTKQFIAQVFIDGLPLEKGYGFSKKKAEQDAAYKSILMLKIE
ncbi:MAG: ribonuclease III [Bacteroidota bacterium]